MGPVLPEIRQDLGISATTAGLLTVTPVICFAIGAFIAPATLRLLSPNRSIALALILLSIGGFVRLLGSANLLLLGTILCGLGAALGNVVGGVIARRDFSLKLGLVMGMYVAAISVSAAAAEIISYPIFEIFDSWKHPLGLWTLIALATLLLWLVSQRNHPTDQPMTGRTSYRYLLRNPIAWALVLYFGFQSTNFHSLAGWLPSILRDAGISATTAGAMTSAMILLGVPTGLVVPILSARFTSQRFLVFLIAASSLIGLSGILLIPTTFTWIWIFFLGLGIGSSFPLALTMTLTKSDSAETARDLNAFMQSWGYVISAMGPIALGAIWDATGKWSWALLALIFGTMIQMFSGMTVGGRGQIHTER